MRFPNQNDMKRYNNVSIKMQEKNNNLQQVEYHVFDKVKFMNNQSLETSNSHIIRFLNDCVFTRIV